MKPELVLVVWEDAGRLDSETWVENIQMKKADPFLFETVGYLLFADEERLVVTGTWSPETIGPRDQIPRGMVRKVVRLKAQKTELKTPLRAPL